MAISDYHAATIVKVRAHFGFSEFACDPDEITSALGIVPEEIGRKGQIRIIRGGREILHLWNAWTICSHGASKDINDHLRELLARLNGVVGCLRDEFGRPFSVYFGRAITCTLVVVRSTKQTLLRG